MDADFRPQNDPIFDEALRAWNGARGEDALPNWDGIDLTQIKRSLPHIVLARVHHDPLDFEFRIIGEHIQERIRRKQTGVRLRLTDDRGPGSAMWRNYVTVFEQKAPLFTTLDYVGRFQTITRTAEMYLPYCSDISGSDQVTRILAVVKFVNDVKLRRL